MTRKIRSGLACSPPAPKPGRRRADHRKTATATREILLQAGGPLRPSDIYSKLPEELQAQIEPDKLSRVLARSKRAGLIYKDRLWSVRPNWLGKSDRKHKRSSRGKLATTRRALGKVCLVALDLLRASGVPLHIDEIIRHADDPLIDRQKLIRALWNRAQAEPKLLLVGNNFYLWDHN